MRSTFVTVISMFLTSSRSSEEAQASLQVSGVMNLGTSTQAVERRRGRRCGALSVDHDYDATHGKPTSHPYGIRKLRTMGTYRADG